MKHISVLWQPIERADIWDGTERVPDENSTGVTESDMSALAWALEIAGSDTRVEVFSVGDDRCIPILRTALSHGATHVCHVRPDTELLDASVVATILAANLPPSELILAGSMWNSGLVPMLLGAHRSLPSVAGVVDLRIDADRCWVRRRLDGGRRQELSVTFPALLAVEAGKSLDRASLPAVLEATNAQIPSMPVTTRAAAPLQHVPWRAPTAWVAPPEGNAAGRIAQLTGNAGAGTTARIAMTATPEAAAAMILEQLRDWGYCAEHDPVG